MISVAAWGKRHPMWRLPQSGGPWLKSTEPRGLDEQVSPRAAETSFGRVQHLPSASKVPSALSAWQSLKARFWDAVARLAGSHRRCEATLDGIGERLNKIRNQTGNKSEAIESLALDTWKLVAGRVKCSIALAKTTRERNSLAGVAFRNALEKVGLEVMAPEEAAAFVAGTLKAAVTVKDLEPAWAAAGLRAFLDQSPNYKSDPQFRRSIVDAFVAAKGALQQRSPAMRKACGDTIAEWLPFSYTVSEQDSG